MGVDPCILHAMQDNPQTAEGYSKTVEGVRSSLGDVCTPLSKGQLLEKATELKGKVVLVTGAGSGIGAAFCHYAATLGAKVVLSDVSTKGLEKTYNEIEHESGLMDRVIKAPLTSVTDWGQLVHLFEWTIEELGSVDVVVSCAGITEAQPDFDEDVLDDQGKLKPPVLRTMDVNLVGTVYTTKLAAYCMKKQKTGGSIVLLGSMSSFFGIPGGPMYAMSKHGVLGFVRSMDYLYRGQNISLNMVAPWFVDTPILGLSTKLILAGLPFAKVSDAVLAMVFSATRKDASGGVVTVDPQGCLYLPADSPIFGSEGFHTTFAKRAVGVISRGRTIQAMVLLIANALAGSSLPLFVVGAMTAFGAYKYMS